MSKHHKTSAANSSSSTFAYESGACDVSEESFRSRLSARRNSASLGAGEVKAGVAGKTSAAVEGEGNTTRFTGLVGADLIVEEVTRDFERLAEGSVRAAIMASSMTAVISFWGVPEQYLHAHSPRTAPRISQRACGAYSAGEAKRCGPERA